MNKITAVILTKNSSKSVRKCIKSISWCDEILIVDDFSTDNTCDLINGDNIKILKRKMNGDFGSQRNFAHKNSSNDWLFFLDTDELCTSKLKNEIIRVTHNVRDDVAGFEMRREDYFLGKLLKHGNAGRSYFRRLVKKNVKWKNSIYEFPDSAKKFEKLENKIIHKREEDISKFIKKANYYSTLESEMLFKNGFIVSPFDIFWQPIKYFLSNYVFRFGFLDGPKGFIFFILSSVLVKFLTLSKIWVMQRN